MVILFAGGSEAIGGQIYMDCFIKKQGQYKSPKIALNINLCFQKNLYLGEFFGWDASESLSRGNFNDWNMCGNVRTNGPPVLTPPLAPCLKDEVRGNAMPWFNTWWLNRFVFCLTGRSWNTQQTWTWKLFCWQKKHHEHRSWRLNSEAQHDFFYNFVDYLFCFGPSPKRTKKVWILYQWQSMPFLP